MITLAVKHTFYHCARRLIAKQAECTFALLRYPFGGDRPSQTAQQKLSSARLTGIAVRTKVNSGWYFNVGSTGIASLGDGLYYFSHNREDYRNKRYFSDIRLYRWDGKSPFSLIEE